MFSLKAKCLADVLPFCYTLCSLCFAYKEVDTKNRSIKAQRAVCNKVSSGTFTHCLSFQCYLNSRVTSSPTSRGIGICCLSKLALFSS